MARKAKAGFFGGGIPIGAAGGTGTLTLARTFNQLSGTSTPTTALWTIGHPFAKAEVPTGNILTATLGGASVRVDAIARKLHADGSLAWAQLLVDYTGVSITAGSSANLVLTSTPGTWSSASGFTDSGWTALVDTVELTSLTFTGTAGSGFTLPSGTWTAKFDGTTQNFIEVYGDCALGRYVWVRSRFVGSDGTTVHATLDCMMEYWVPKLVGGGAGPVLSRGPFVRNVNIFSQSNIGEYDYTATWKRGGVAQRTFNGVRHASATHATCCRLDGLWDRSDGADANVWVSQSYANTRKTKKIPPFADGISYPTGTDPLSQALLGITAVSSGNITYTVTGATGSLSYLFGKSPTQGVTAVDFTATAGGVTAGTVYWAKYGSTTGGTTTFTLYDTQAHAIAGGATGQITPTSALIGVNVRVCIAPQSPGCLDQAMSSGGGNSPDIALFTEYASAYHIANTYDFQRLGRVQAYNSGSIYNWCKTDNSNTTALTNGLGNAAILPSAMDATGNAQSPATPTGMTSYPTLSGTNGGTDTGFVNGWTAGSDTPREHMPESIYPVWVMEGGPYLRDLMMQRAAQLALMGFAPYRNYQVTAAGPVYYGSSVFNQVGQGLRIGAWNLRAFALAEFSSPQGSAYETYFQNLITSNCNQLKADITFKDQATSVSNSGGSIISNGQNTYAKLGVAWQVSATNPVDTNSQGLAAGVRAIESFMQTYTCAAVAFAAMLREDVLPGLGFAADFNMQWLNQFFNNPSFCPYFATTYVINPNLTPVNGLDPGTYTKPFGSTDPQPGTPLVAGNDFYDYTAGTPGVVTRQGGNTGAWFPADGDIFRALNYQQLNDQNSVSSPPAALTVNTDYYVRNPNTSTGAFNLSATPTGSLIAFASSVTGGTGDFVVKAHSCPTAGSGTVNAGGGPGLATDANDYAAYHVAACALHAVRGSLNASTCYDTASLWFIGQSNYSKTCLWAYQKTL